MDAVSESVRQHPLYPTWSSMIGRCHNPKHPDFATYGGRGIQVCPMWRESFSIFAEQVGCRPEGTTLDRIDNARGYEPGNVRWATRHEQALNRRGTKLYPWKGEQVTLKVIAADSGIDATTLYSRLKKGLSLEEAIRRPVDHRFNPHQYQASR